MTRSVCKKLVPVFILFFVLSTITAPARAFLPAVAAVATFVSSGSTAANAIAAVTVGTIAGTIWMANQNGGSGTKEGSFMDVPAGASRDRPMDTPNGWTAPADANSQPTPPNDAPRVLYYYTGSISSPYSTGSTMEEACIGFFSSGALPGYSFTSVSVPNYCNGKSASTGLIGTQAFIFEANGCPKGYVVNATGSCTLSTPSDVPKPPDGRCQVLGSVNGFQIDPNDPECSDLASKTGTTVSDKKITSAPAGSSSKSEITINADGSRTITETRANADGKTSTITTITMVPAAGGSTATITGTSTTTVQGQGSLAGASGSAAPAIDIKFPDDYNREATQQGIKTKLDQIQGQTDLSGTAPPPAAAAATEKAGYEAETKKITDSLSTAQTDYGNNKGLGWFSWLPTMPVGTCSPISGAVMGKTVTWNFCKYVTMINETIGWLLAIFTVWTIYGVFFRRSN